MPPVKEVHYFDRSPDYPSPNKLAESKLSTRLRQPAWLFDASLRCAYALVKGGPSALKWKTKWFFSNYSDDWYLSLFDGVDAITGDITPAYSILSPEDVARVHSLLPQAKIVYLLRNPIERSWSSYRKQYLRSGDRLELDDMLKYLASSTIASRSDYVSTIDLYTAQYGREHVIISSYDALKSKPVEMLSEIVAFLGGRPELVEQYCAVDRVTNPSPAAALPEEVKKAMSDWYRPTIEELVARYGCPFDSWMHMGEPDWTESTDLVFHP